LHEKRKAHLNKPSFIMKNQASFAWKANSEGLNKKNNTFQLNYNSCIADGKEYCFRTILIVNQLSEKAISFPSTIVLLSFNEKNITVNNGVIHKKRHKVNGARK